MANRQKESKEARDGLISNLFIAGICIFTILGMIYAARNTKDNKMTDREAMTSISKSIGVATNDAEHLARMQRMAEIERSTAAAIKHLTELEIREGRPGDWINSHIAEIASALKIGKEWQKWGNGKMEGMAKANACPKVEIRIYNNITGPAETITINNPELIEIVDVENQECILKMDFLHAKRNIKSWKEKKKK